MGRAATRSPGRRPLSRARVLQSAIGLADRDGLGPLSMRRLGQELGVEAMSLYHHVANKEDLLDGMVEAVVTELNAAVGSGPDGPVADWVSALRTRILAAREVMLRHRWAPALIESRTTLSPGVIAYYEGVLATLVAGGFSYDLAHHTLHALGSKALGFNQELFDPVGAAGDGEAQPDADLAAMAEHFPHLVGMLAEIVHEGPETTIGWCDDQTEFEFGLDVLLDGLERRRAGVTGPDAAPDAAAVTD